MTDDEKRRLRRRARYYAMAGVLAGLLCNLLPPEYQAACHALANICTGGI